MLKSGANKCNGRGHWLCSYCMAELSQIFQEAITTRTFPGGVVWLAHGDKLLAHEAFGSTAYASGTSTMVACDTIYDIASLTKLFTTTAFLIAAHAAQVDVQTPVYNFFPAFKTTAKSAITLRHLMQHSSGIEIAIQNLVDVPVEQWSERIASAPLRAAPGTGVLYSCSNYFLLGRVVEILSGQRLDVFIEEQLLRPLGTKRTGYRPLQKFKQRQIAPTEVEGVDEDLMPQPWHGVVHDEAARAVEAAGGACGNAGLFSTAADLSRFAQLWLNGGAFNGRQIIAEADVRRALTDIFDDGSARRGLGWQLDAEFYMSNAAPRHSAGHAGFTGPTLWLNPQTRHVAIVLNNRVYPTRHGPNRMPYHRRIAQWLLCQTT